MSLTLAPAGALNTGGGLHAREPPELRAPFVPWSDGTRCGPVEESPHVPANQGALSQDVACVLVADEGKDDRSQLAAVIGHMGHRVLEAADAQMALALTRAHVPDVVITDPLMPAADGSEFVRDLRSDRNVGSVPVIFCTPGYVEAEVRSLAAALRRRPAFLPKPCEPQTIVKVVSEVLGVAPPCHSRTLRPPSAGRAERDAPAEGLRARGGERRARAHQHRSSSLQRGPPAFRPRRLPRPLGAGALGVGDGAAPRAWLRGTAW